MLRTDNKAACDKIKSDKKIKVTFQGSDIGSSNFPAAAPDTQCWHPPHPTPSLSLSLETSELHQKDRLLAFPAARNDPFMSTSWKTMARPCWRGPRIISPRKPLGVSCLQTLHAITWDRRYKTRVNHYPEQHWETDVQSSLSPSYKSVYSTDAALLLWL